MPESRELRAARRSLAEAEARLGTDEGLKRLAEGVGYLEDLVAGGGTERAVARNLATSYAGRVYGRVRALLEGDAQVPEPELEHHFKVVLALDPLDKALPLGAAELKVAVVRALIDRYYEGHPPERKHAALAELAALRRS